MSKQFLYFCLLLLPVFAGAQTSPEMADGFRSDGKIYVVIAVIGIIFASLIGFLIYLERKVSRLEKQQNAKQS